MALGRTAMERLNRIWKDRMLTIATKSRLVRALVFPIAIYGYESWTTRKADRRRVGAFQHWGWRRMLQIP